MTAPSVSVTRCARPGVPSLGHLPATAARTTVARTLAVHATMLPSRFPPGGCPSWGTAPSWRGRYRPAPARALGPGVRPAPALSRLGLTERTEWRVDAWRSWAAGQPAPPAGIRAGRRSPRQWRGRAVGHRPGPPRTPPGRRFPPAGAGCPPVPGPPRGLSFSRPVAGLYLCCAERHSGSCGGPGLTGRAERSVRRHRPTDGPPPGTPTAPGRPPAAPAREPGTPDDPLLTIEEVTTELRVSRAAFYRWRRHGAGPPVMRLPGGTVRVRRSALIWWLRRLEEATTAEEHETYG